MNNKGFTLIELLSVIVILLSISVIAISSISAAIERNKERQNATKIEVIENYAKLWYDAHKGSLNGRTEIYFSDLDLSDSELEDVDGNPFCGYIKIVNNQTFEFIEDLTRCGEYTIKSEFLE